MRLSSFISLRDGIEIHGPLGEQELYHLALSLVSCLDDLHSKGAHHGFLSPDFVALSKDGTVKLGASTKNASSSTLPEYIAPEVLTGTRVSSLSDIYQLGLLLHESVACSKPFSFEDPEMKASSIYKIKPFPDSIAVNKKFAAIIYKCYDKDSSRRFANASDLLKALKMLSEDKGPFSDYKPEEVNFTKWFEHSFPATVNRSVSGIITEVDEQTGSLPPLDLYSLVRTLLLGMITFIAIYGLLIFFYKSGDNSTINHLRISFVSGGATLKWSSPEEFRRFKWDLYSEDHLLKSGVSEGSSFSTYYINLDNLKNGNLYKVSLYDSQSEVGQLAFTYTGEVD